jgi:predicted RND superfamily exporter protein
MSTERPTFVVRHRHAVRATLVAVAALFLLAIPRLEARFAPEELVAPDEDATRATESMTRAFGPDEQALVILVEADDVLSPHVLDWTHRVALFLAGLPGVARVESLGTTPLPHETASDGSELTLEALEAEAAGASSARERAEEALGDVVASDPERFPQGLLSLAERGGAPIEISRAIAGERATAAERARVEDIVRLSALVRGRLVSEDRTVAVVAAILETGATEDVGALAVQAASLRLSRVPPPEGARAQVAGLPAMRVTMVRALRQDQLLLVTLAAIGSLVVLLLGMRSAAGILIPMGTVAITLAISVGGMAVLGVPINLLTNVIPPLLVTIGLAEAVHMVLRYREELRAAQNDRILAASRTLRTMWLACFVTTFTTAIGFGALVLQETALLREFGIVAAVAVMISYAVTVVYVPASLPDFANVGGDTSQSALPGQLDLVIVTIARATARRPWLTIGASSALLALSVLLARDVVVDSTLLDQFDRDSEIARATRLMESELDGVRGLSIGLEGEPGRFLEPRGVAELEDLAEWLREQPGVLRATTYSDWLHEAWALVTREESARAEALRTSEQIRALRALVASGDVDPTARYVTDDGRAARIEVRLADRGASRILAMLDRLEERAGALPGVTLTFSGEAWDASRGLDRIVSSLGSLASAIVLIFLVMMLLFRSVRLGLLSIPPNALPLAMTLAYMVVRGIPLNAATVIVFTVTVGLAVDGATHVIARFREEQQRGLPMETTLLRTMETSGRGVVLSSLTLLLGYGALLFSAFEPVRVFGELSAVAIGASLVAQLVLLPALLAAFVPQRAARPALQADPAEQ